MTRRLVARLAASSVLGLAAMNAGCSESPSSPTVTSVAAPSPPPPPAVFAIASVTPSAGPTIGGDYVRISGNRLQSGATVTLDGIAAQVTWFPGAFIEVRTPAHALGAVDIVVTNPDGERAALQGAYLYAPFAIAGTPSVVMAGGEVTVTFEAPSGRGCQGGGDWIAIYKVGDPDNTGASNGHSDLWYEHVCGATSGKFTLHAPSEPGTYEFRYMVGGTSVARSNPVTIQAS